MGGDCSREGINRRTAIIGGITVFIELLSRIESNMPFYACVCPYAYALTKTRLQEPLFKIIYTFDRKTFSSYRLKFLGKKLQTNI